VYILALPTADGRLPLFGVCGTCIDARGISSDDVIERAHRSTMDELATWTTWADKVLLF